LKLCLKKAEMKSVQYESGTSKRYLRVIAVPITGSGVLLLFQDLTSLRNLQTTRRELIGNISHEFRTPLAGIKAMVETLHGGAIDDKKAAGDFLNRIDSEVDRLTQLVAELTELSRIETGRAELKLEPVDLNSIVEEVATQLKPQVEREKLTVVRELAADLPPVPADAARVRQVMLNLLHNAIKFTEPGGQITVSTRKEGDSVITAIADNGRGIASDDLPHVFERFYKGDKARSGEGTGLGLAISQQLCRTMGGDILVESEPGQGSTFTICLPLEVKAGKARTQS